MDGQPRREKRDWCTPILGRHPPPKMFWDAMRDFGKMPLSNRGPKGRTMNREIDQLRAARTSTQKLVNKILRLIDKKEATDQDLCYARRAAEMVRFIYRDNQFPVTVPIE